MYILKPHKTNISIPSRHATRGARIEPMSHTIELFDLNSTFKLKDSIYLEEGTGVVTPDVSVGVAGAKVSMAGPLSLEGPLGGTKGVCDGEGAAGFGRYVYEIEISLGDGFQNKTQVCTSESKISEQENERTKQTSIVLIVYEQSQAKLQMRRQELTQTTPD
ncbi:hypothetical protein Scep_022547 [Stephania cephalantha]|uniref:Uncharacterized protein n=1 Tax=Stephania cephalantha TaxID=152367 RepID=A0AAP0HXW1_9MAGN